MRIQELYENSESEEMADRAWRRSILSGHINSIPQIFSLCYMRPREDFGIAVNVGIRRFGDIEFVVYYNKFHFHTYFLVASQPLPNYVIADALHDALGVKVTDIEYSRESYAVYGSEQLKAWLIPQFKPWAWFMTIPDTKQFDRFKFLRARAGSAITSQDLPFLVGK